MTAGPRKPSRWRRFVSDESGSISIEAVLWIPVLLAAWLLMVSAAAAYHAVIGNVNGAHAVGDVVSRQTQVLDAADLDDLNALHRLISQSGTGTDVRITTLRFDAADNSFALLGSLAAENAPALSQAEVDALANTLPAVPDGDQLTGRDLAGPRTPERAACGDFQLSPHGDRAPPPRRADPLGGLSVADRRATGVVSRDDPDRDALRPHLAAFATACRWRTPASPASTTRHAAQSRADPPG
ncbi:MAG: hypothetical protein RI538_11910 [Salibaculum sp.]|uniref:TadE/TadG family type IV pilus assembly protein n=1 Tax=Salibaculum sp. TaxID=2855480 RepID=UPI00286FD967|nr:hypothetical protein [Salibaculum sp.]MDR9426916.1 hypothetical protein [Salibaculum sp.]MDR9483463.1 hypothetical protein [Salibaculum sp.]